MTFSASQSIVMISSGERIFSGFSDTIPSWEYKMPENGLNSSALTEAFKSPERRYSPMGKYLENTTSMTPSDIPHQ